MREIKFRAWDKKKNEMLTVVVLNQYKYTDGSYCGFCEGFGKEMLSKEFKLSDIELMQYTGLKDKNGKEIYEGDIVNVIEAGRYGGEYNAEIKYIDIFSMFGIQCVGVKAISHHQEVDSLFTRGFLTRHNGSCINLSDALSFTKCEIIGNIYENPELLKS